MKIMNLLGSMEVFMEETVKVDIHRRFKSYNRVIFWNLFIPRIN